MLEDPFVDPQAITFMLNHDIDMELVMEKPMPFLKDVVFDLIKSESLDKNKKTIDADVKIWLKNNKVKLTKWLLNDVKQSAEVRDNLVNSIMEQTFKIEQLQVVVIPAGDFVKNVTALPMHDNVITQDLKSDEIEEKSTKEEDDEYDYSVESVDLDEDKTNVKLGWNQDPNEWKNKENIQDLMDEKKLGAFNYEVVDSSKKFPPRPIPKGWRVDGLWDPADNEM
jgi:hypothetical protein